jgi:hypothetical protein
VRVVVAIVIIVAVVVVVLVVVVIAVVVIVVVIVFVWRFRHLPVLPMAVTVFYSAYSDGDRFNYFVCFNKQAWNRAPTYSVFTVLALVVLLIHLYIC